MNRTGVILPPDEDPDATDRLPALDEGAVGTHADPLESTGTWSSSSAELADRTARLEQALEERDAAVADLTSLLRQRTFALTRVEKELEQARSELLRAHVSAGSTADLEQRLGEVERGRAELAAQRDEQRAAIGRLEDQLSESREAEQRLERQLLALREESDARERARETASERLAGSEARIVELEDRLASATRETLSASQQQEHAQLRDRLAEMRNALAATREELAAATAARDALQAHADRLSAELDALRQSLRDSGLETAGLLERLRSAEARRRYGADMRRAAVPAPLADPQVATLTRQLRDERAASRGKLRDLTAALEQEREARAQAERALAERDERLGRLEAEAARREQVLARVPAAPAARPARRCLARLDPGQEAVFDLVPPRVSIGRTPDNDLLVRESYISRNHAVIRLGPDSAVIEDLASRNGVFVNGRRVTRELLRDGDVVVLGKARFRFEAGLA